MVNDQYTSTCVLIVDDSEYIRTIMTTLFKKAGITKIHIAADGGVAIDKYKEVKPDIIILDVMLPKKSGMEVLKEIRSTDTETKVIMISSLATQEFIKEAKEAGANYYFIKPYDNQVFMKIVRELLNQQKH